MTLTEQARQKAERELCEYGIFLASSDPEKVQEFAHRVVVFREAVEAEAVKDSDARELRIAEAVREEMASTIEHFDKMVKEPGKSSQRARLLRGLDLTAIIKEVRDGK